MTSFLACGARELWAHSQRVYSGMQRFRCVLTTLVYNI